ncbi:hypothetical protein LTR62_001787 [Meristemomyces frigidus]|uniref:Cation-transporting P-type ATPase N-terminal domain-containing protein n=1 Tax=Meristemomyces frigidus TaxID=1508187 RepID=A0AAN7TK16_9PEZI|nr:hypothetical protein LTR62_001787 [Meristemomyces frigidus]
MDEEALAQSSTVPADTIAGKRGTQVVFDEDDRPAREQRTRHSLSRSRRRSSIESARSVRERQITASTVPIGFRTLSFQVSASQAKRDEVTKQPGLSLKQSKKAIPKVTNFEATDLHTIDLNSLYERLRTSPKSGLSQESVTTRLQQDGPNVLPTRHKSYAKKLLGYIFGGFCSILWIGVIIFFICWRPLGDPNPQPYNLGLAILVIIVILLQASFSAFQDWSTAKTMNAILDMLPADALAMRDGEFTTMKARDLVVGDVVKLRVGDKVPADLRLAWTSGDVRFDRAAMTGESEEVGGGSECTDPNFLETKNMALMGTLITNGSALGVVVLTGAKTVMGGIAMATSEVKDKPTSIQKEITRFVYIIVGLTSCLALLILLTWVGWLRVQHKDYMTVVAMLNDVMGCVVAFIPEGMPVGVALTLMMVARRMRSADVLPKSLTTVEMLGCVNVICSDKTGTLTKNQMVVTSVGFVEEDTTADLAIERLDSGEASEALIQLRRAALLCNEANFDPLTMGKPVAERLIQGNPTDGAILRFAESTASPPGYVLIEAYPQIAQIAFNSKNKFALTLHQIDGEHATSERCHCLAIAKGAPDVLLPHCTTYLALDGSIKPFDSAASSRLSALQSQLAHNAQRVLMLCQRNYELITNPRPADLEKHLLDNCMTDLTIVGLVGIFDPPRPEAKATVEACRRAGIKFFMMTGDFGLTGAAIARQIGIFTGVRTPDSYDAIVRTREPGSEKDDEAGSRQNLLLEGTQISALEAADWDLVAQYEEIVFGRCSPEHKLLIVNELQKRGYSAAVTGDGVNDSPALKAADVGVAMVNGSDVALEAADLVLMGDFDKIIDGIRLGRLVFQNLQKVIGYLLPAGSWSEIWPVLISVFFGVPLPLSSFLMIIICVFTDLALSLSLIMEKQEFDLLSLPPRNPKTDHLINLKIYVHSYLFIGVLETISAHAMFFLYYWRHARIPLSALFFAFEKYNDPAGFYGYSADELVQFNVTGQSIYFVTLVILQLGNILSVRNKRLSILQADPFTKQRRNPWLLVGAVVAVGIAVFVTEIPGIQRLFGTAAVPWEFWVLPLPLAVGILCLDEGRKAAVRFWPEGWLARIAW